MCFCIITRNCSLALLARRGSPGDPRRSVDKLRGMRPDIIIEYVSGLRIFLAETEQGREWLKNRNEISAWQRVGLSIAVEDEKLAKDWPTPQLLTTWM
jgi:hypothetical protein